MSKSNAVVGTIQSNLYYAPSSVMFDSVPNKSEQIWTVARAVLRWGDFAKLKLADFKLIICFLFLLTYLTYYRVSIIAYHYSYFYCLI